MQSSCRDSSAMASVFIKREHRETGNTVKPWHTTVTGRLPGSAAIAQSLVNGSLCEDWTIQRIRSDPTRVILKADFRIKPVGPLGFDWPPRPFSKTVELPMRHLVDITSDPPSAPPHFVILAKLVKEDSETYTNVVLEHTIVVAEPSPDLLSTQLATDRPDLC